MSAVARAYTFTDGTDAYGSQVENEFNTIYNAWNNHDAGTSKWTVVSALNASAAPLIADNSSGTNDIVNFKDNSTTVFKVADGGNTTLQTGNLIFGTTGKGITGTATNDSASAGNVGEYMSQAQQNQAIATSTQFGNVCSITLSAGDWDISGVGNAGGGTFTVGGKFSVAISSNSNNTTTDHVLGDNVYELPTPTASSASYTGSIPSYRVSLT